MAAFCPAISPADFNRWIDRVYAGEFACWQCVAEVLREDRGIMLPTASMMPSERDDPCDLIQRHHSTYGFHPVSPNSVQPYDVLVFRVGRNLAHVGLVVTRGVMLHAGRDLPSCLERYTGFAWRHRLEGVYRYSS